VRASDAASAAVNVSVAARSRDTAAAERPIDTALTAAYKTDSHTEVRTFDGSGNCALWSMRRTT